MVNIPGLEALRLALYPIAGATEGGGPLAMNIGGTVNILGGGTGGTAMVDNSTFTANSTSFTPIGGYHGGRTVASGNAAAAQIDGSGNLQVNVVAGGAGGGVANVTVRGSGNQDIHVGYVGGGSVNSDGGAYMPILGSVNIGGLVGSVNVTQGTLPLPVVGSVNVAGSLGVGQLAAPWSMVGSVNVTPVASFTVNPGSTWSVWYGGIGADTANSAIRVNLVAGGGGVANLEVQGTNNTAIRVGFASGAGLFADGGAYVPIGFASTLTPSMGVFGLGGSMGVAQITNPWTVTGSVNITGSINPVGIFGSLGALVGSVNITGSINPVGIFGSLGALVGSVNVTPVASFTVNPGSTWSVWYGGIGADTTNSAIRVNVVAGGAGGGVSNVTVRGSANTDLHVGYASGAGVNVDGGAYMPVLFSTGNIPSLAVYGSLVVTGSVNITGSINPVGIFGSLGALVGSVNITGSINPVGIFGSLGALVGSVNITGSINPVGIFGSVSTVGSSWIGNVPPVDTSASLVPTIFPINVAASGYNTLCAGPGSNKLKFFGVNLTTDATVGFNVQSPSGTYITGSLMNLAPLGGLVAQNVIRNPVWIGGSTATVFIYLTATAHVAGWLQAYNEP